jgi:hypothetical protein
LTAAKVPFADEDAVVSAVGGITVGFSAHGGGGGRGSTVRGVGLIGENQGFKSLAKDI